MEGSIWFRRFKREVEAMSPHFRFVRVKLGFYRIYWIGGGEPAYVHEVYKWMPKMGYDIEERDPRFDSHRYYQEYEEQAELTLKIKNFVEGYDESIGVMRKRLYLFRNNKEFYQNAVKAYRNVRVR